MHSPGKPPPTALLLQLPSSKMQNPLRIAPGIVAGLAAAALGFGSVAGLAAAAAVLAAAYRAVGMRRRGRRALEAAAVPLAAGPSLA